MPAHTSRPSPLFSIILPTRDRPAMLRRAVSSVRSQSLRDFELIVVDDGSAEAFEGFPRDPRIQMIRSRTSFGVAQARNIGIDAAKGAYISFLDDDDEYLPSFLRATYETLKSSPGEVGVSWCGAKFIDYPVGGNASPTERVLEFAKHEDRRTLIENYVSIGMGFGVTMKSACLKKLGLFNGALKVSSDSDMFFRILVNGFIPILVPGVHVVIHNHQEGRLTSSNFNQERIRTWEDWIFVEYSGFLDENPILKSYLVNYIDSLKKTLVNAPSIETSQAQSAFEPSD
jgi:glycosyltransferase involved in cell wall biosynthesis